MTSFAVIPGCDHPGKDDINTRGEAEAAKDTHVDLCPECSEDDVVIDDGIEEPDVEVVRHGEDGQEVVADGEGEPSEAVTDQLPEKPAVDEDPLAQLGEELGTDPLDILPGHMVDNIQGQPAVNKRGYAMIAERYGIEASAEIEVYPWENDEGRCVARARAITDDGREYSGWATACAGDGDMDAQIIELAETRALKRCVSWASGVGIVSYQELSNQLEDA